jgi:hypothetical protein
MALVGDRQEIADALSTIDGIKGYMRRPTAWKAGDAWTRLTAIERSAGMAYGVTWTVSVILGTDETLAETRTDELIDDLFDSLEPVAFVQSVTPALYQTQAGDFFALEITLFRE